MNRETLICDTSFVSHLLQREETPDRYAQWDKRVMGRVASEVLAICVVTIAEIRAGYLKAGWGREGLRGLNASSRSTSPC